MKDKAEEAGPWLTRQQRRRISAWEKRTQPAPAAPTKPTTRVSVLPAAAVADTARPTQQLSGARRPPADVDAVADTARDVLEHTARLGATIGWDRLCEQVKGLAELTETQQRQALKSASRSRSAQPLAALITTGDGTPHPHSRHLAGVGDGPIAQAAWQRPWPAFTPPTGPASHRPAPGRADVPADQGTGPWSPLVVKVAGGRAPRICCGSSSLGPRFPLHC